MSKLIDKKKALKSLEVARMYYEADMGQVEISNQLNLSRPTVSRLLQFAQDNGIVQIKIVDPFSCIESLEATLQAKYGLKEAHVIYADYDNYKNLTQQLGVYTANYLSDIVSDGDIIGVSWGTTLYEVADALQSQKAENVQIVELKGSVTYTPTPVYGEDVLMKFGEAFHTAPHELPLPVVFENQTTHDVVLKDRYIKKLIDLGKKTNIAIFTVGTTRDDALLFKTGYFDKNDIRKLQKNAVGDICSRFINENGDIAVEDVNNRTMGIELTELKEKEHSILVAGGKRKYEAIKAALAGKYANCLVTDVETAQKLINE
jgi:deoxyribonucleoside regulator